MLYYVGLVPFYLFLFIVQWVTKVWGEVWVDAIEQGGYTLDVWRFTLASQWDGGRAGATLTCDWVGIFALNERGHKTFCADQYIIW